MMKKATSGELHFPLVLFIYYLGFLVMAKVGSIGVYLAWMTLLTGLAYSFIKCTKPIKPSSSELLFKHANS